MDGSYRSRDNSSRAINIVCGAKLKHKDSRGLSDTVIDHITAGRDTGAGVPLGPVCALSRNGGECHVHGKAVDWDRRTKPDPSASAEEKQAADKITPRKLLLLHRGAKQSQRACHRSPRRTDLVSPAYVHGFLGGRVRALPGYWSGGDRA